MNIINWILGLFSKKPSPTPIPNPDPTAPVDVPKEMLLAHNAERTNVGVPSLRLNLKLVAAASSHARWMYDNQTMSHTGKGRSSSSDRIKGRGYNARATGENIAAGYNSIQSVMNGWMHSSGHRANILSNTYIEAGFAVDGNYWCSVFAAPGKISIHGLMIVSDPEGIVGDE